ncbi:serine hydrolase domain-containing protein [Spirosoma oryzicola]|uniref:serine hydrolase domain-containing protein n=1 Tax=Spirosoma oryzicola TaxID=2898794 RepID=UPI001E31C09E|nr:serine hydrolase domain-containing protein [Spirosoma oryzicola]UHG94627.1 beta-lactamase family protein [Spirosoma oryzicola]
MSTHNPFFLTAYFDVFAQAKSVDSSVQAYVKEHQFSGTLVVQQKGKLIYQNSFGVANRSFDIPIQQHTRFRIASITKLFTSVIVMQLVQEGKLDLNQPIHTYLPSLTDEKSFQIKVHHLLNHSYGIDNIENRGIENIQNSYTTDELLLKYYNNPLKYSPGTHFEYNNGDFLMLGKIVEQVCHQSYPEVLAERILVPLQLKETGILIDQRVIKQLASTYSLNPKTNQLYNDIPYYIENFFTAGAMYSTVNYVLTFANALFANKLLKPATLALLLTSSPQLDSYGYGLWVRKYSVEGKTYTIAERPGRIAGANALLSYLQEEDLTIVSLSNTNTTNHEHFHNEIRKSLGIRVW